jgi:hypothetical protein
MNLGNTVYEVNARSYKNLISLEEEQGTSYRRTTTCSFCMPAQSTGTIITFCPYTGIDLTYTNDSYRYTVVPVLYITSFTGWKTAYRYFMSSFHPIRLLLC